MFREANGFEMTPNDKPTTVTINDWYRKWDNYQLASGWGQGENHKTLAYLCTCVSDEIRTAINFDSLRTMQNALHQIKEYLNMAIMPLNLQ